MSDSNNSSKQEPSFLGAFGSAGRPFPNLDSLGEDEGFCGVGHQLIVVDPDNTKEVTRADVERALAKVSQSRAPG